MAVLDLVDLNQNEIQVPDLVLRQVAVEEMTEDHLMQVRKEDHLGDSMT